jgi:hypothetical protein
MQHRPVLDLCLWPCVRTQNLHDATYDFAAYNSAPYNTAAHDTAAYDTVAYDTVAYDTAAYDTAAYDTAAHDAAAHDAAALYLPTQDRGYGVQQRPVLDLRLWPCVRTQNVQEADDHSSAYDDAAADARYHEVPTEEAWDALW